MAAVVLPDPDGVMKMGGERRGAHKSGSTIASSAAGDLLSARGGRRFELGTEAPWRPERGARVRGRRGAAGPRHKSDCGERPQRSPSTFSPALSRDDDRSGPGCRRRRFPRPTA